ncbi:MAG: SCP2 sterol-binding domain-containing protein [Methylophilaceae bacterium]
MLKPLLTKLLNHLINQNLTAKEQLQPFASKSVNFRLPPLNVTLVVLEDGGLAIAGESSTPEATVTIPMSVALRLLANDEAANSLITLEGDSELAATLAKVLRGFSWNYEEDLSRIVGAMPASKVTSFGRKATEQVSAQAQNAIASLTEYLREDQQLIAANYAIQQFLSDVDDVRDDAERLAKRLQKLEAAITEKLNKKPAA